MGAPDQLQGWKEIAAYLRRDERTAKRWEKQRGLPVRRIPGGGRANVYCIVSELQQWLDGEAVDNASAVTLLSVDPPADTTYVAPPEDLPTLTSSAPALPSAAFAARWTPPYRVMTYFAALCVVCLFGVSLRLATHERITSIAQADPRKSTQTAPPQAARDLFLEGQYLVEERTPASLTRARIDFQSAIDLAPNFAEAYAGLANTYLLLREYSTMPSVDAYRQAREAAQHALRLNGDLPEAHVALGFIDFFFSWQPREAEAEFQTALRLDPRSVLARHWYGSMLLHQARYSEALTQLNIARSLAPASPAILACQALALGLSGQRDEASDLLETLDSNGHETASLHRTLAVLSLIQPRDLPRYLSETRRFAQMRQDKELLAVVGEGEKGFRENGEAGLWSAMAQGEQRFHAAGRPTYLIADLDAATGDNAEALHDLNTLADQHDPEMIGIAMDPFLTSLRRTGNLHEIALRMDADHPTPAMLATSVPVALFRLP